ncbi:MAG: TolC family protein [Acidobacteria bacterium]|nr:TolC family protein [Acidobacteriota bacterium]
MGLLFLVAILLGNRPIAAQQNRPTQLDYSQSPSWFPPFYGVSRSQPVPRPDPNNSPILPQWIRGDKLELSVAGLLSAVVENNLDIAVARYNTSFAETDLLRARSGQAPRGVEGARVPSGLFAGAIGTGLGGGGSGAGGGGGGITGAARQVVIGPRGSFDPSLSLSFNMGRTTSPLNTIRVAGVPTVSTASTSLRLTYSQAFTSGTSFSLSFNAQRQGSTQQFLLFNPAFSSGFNLSLNQRLLNGFGFAINRRFLRVAETEQQIAREVFRQQVITTLTNAQNQYWDLVAAQERVRVAEQALQVAQQLYEDNRKRVEVGTLAPLDALAAQAEVAARQRDLIVAQTGLQMQELALKNLLSRQSHEALEAARIETTDPLPEPRNSDIPSLEEAMAAALRSRAEFRQGELNIANQEVAVQSTKDRLKPSLDVFALLASSARAADLGGSLGQAGRFDFPEYALGFSLTIPLLNRSAQADDLRARLEQRQAETSLQQTRNQIRLEVRNAIIGLMQAKAQVEAVRTAVELNRQTVEAEQKKLQAGVSTPYNVIRVQRDLLSAQFAEVQARVAYGKALVELDRATGQTLQRHQIDLDHALRGRLT